MKTRSTSASHSLEGQGTKSTIVKWSIVLLTCESTVKEFSSEWAVWRNIFANSFEQMCC